MLGKTRITKEENFPQGGRNKQCSRIKTQLGNGKQVQGEQEQSNTKGDMIQEGEKSIMNGKLTRRLHRAGEVNETLIGR